MDNLDKHLPTSAMTMSNTNCQSGKARRRSLHRKRKRMRLAAERVANAPKAPADMATRPDTGKKDGGEEQKADNTNATSTAKSQYNSTPKSAEAIDKSTPTKTSVSVRKDATAGADDEGCGTSKQDPGTNGQKLGINTYNELSPISITPPNKTTFAEDYVLSTNKRSGTNGELSSAADEDRVEVFANSGPPSTGCIRRAQLVEDTSDGAKRDGNNDRHNNAVNSPDIVSRTATGSEGTPTPAARQSVLKSIEVEPNTSGDRQEQFVSGASAEDDKVDTSKEVKQEAESPRISRKIVNKSTAMTTSAIRRRQSAPPQQHYHYHRPSASCLNCVVFRKPCVTVDPSHRDLAIASLRISKCAQVLQLSVQQLSTSACVYQRTAEFGVAGANSGQEPAGLVKHEVQSSPQLDRVCGIYTRQARRNKPAYTLRNRGAEG